MTVSAWSLEPLEALDTAAVADVRRIYEEGFAPRLRVAFSALINQRQDGELTLALTCSGRPSGFAMTRPLGDTGWVFLRYFVVDHRQRSQGLGGILWNQVTARLCAAGNTVVVFDVEDPAEPGCAQPESRARSRRISFYQRRGASVLPVLGYVMPPLTAAGTDWTPMLLMASSLTGTPLVADAQRVRALVTAVYQHRWQMEPDHPQVVALVSAIRPVDRAGDERLDPSFAHGV